MKAERRQGIFWGSTNRSEEHGGAHRDDARQSAGVGVEPVLASAPDGGPAEAIAAGTSGQFTPVNRG